MMHDHRPAGSVTVFVMYGTVIVWYSINNIFSFVGVLYADSAPRHIIGIGLSWNAPWKGWSTLSTHNTVQRLGRLVL